VVKDNFAMKDGELTLKGFLELHQMEAEDNGGDETSHCSRKLPALII
jgi:hypothetical protein